MKSAASIVKIFLVCFAVYPVNSLDAAEKSPFQITESRIKQIEKRLLEKQKELLNVNIKQQDILAEIERLEKRISEDKRELGGLSERIKELSSGIRKSHREVQLLKNSYQDTQKRLEKRLTSFYKFGKAGYFMLIAGSKTIQDFQKMLKYMKSIMDQDKDIMNTLSMQRQNVKNGLIDLEKNMEKLESLKREKDNKVNLLEKSLERKIVLLMKVHREKVFHEKAIEELKDAARDLNNTMMGLKEAGKGGVLPGGFDRMKGELPLPLNGEPVTDLEKSGSSLFIHRKGLFLKGSPGDEVRSVYSGRVDYSGWFKGYGQLMIINHGSHYFTVFAHLDERFKEKGDAVYQGERVGTVGNTGLNEEPWVYLEIRKGGNQLDPKKWFKIDHGKGK